ncbi:hypothetical protein [Peribacillus sp. Hz7]|uniref:hypothetical protein n=1 Tax=Peribacillus sp. Hz7 TaxID=3344873 RepID=UPI0035CA84AA
MGNQIKQILLGLVAFLSVLGLYVFPSTAFASSEISLNDLEPSDTTYYFHENRWSSNSNFTDVHGNLLANGIGLYDYDGGGSHATYNIDNMGYRNFQGRITLDSQWLVGDYGKSAIGIYADDLLLYTKQIPKDKVLEVNLKLPKTTKNLHIVVKQLQGAKGEQRVVITDGKFTSSGSYLNVSDTTTSLATIGAQDHSYYYNYGQWDSNSVFQDVKGNITISDLGLYTYNGGRAYATFNIDQMGYNVFETKITLDSKWITGDYGKTAVGIYADDVLLYEKQLTAKTAVQKVKLHIPKGTKNIILVTQQNAGARGTQKVVFIDPVVKKTKDKVKTVNKTVSLNTVGATNNSYYFSKNSYSDSSFQDIKGNLLTSGISLSTYNGGDAYAEYDIQNMDFNGFLAKLSLDSKWVTGDYGKSTIYIYADNKILYSKKLTKNSAVSNLKLRIPSNAKTFKVVVKQVGGAKGTHKVILNNAVLTKMKVSSTLKTSQIKVVNNKKKSDVVTVSSLKAGDYIKVYNSKGTLLATSKKATKTSVSVSIKQLGKSKGTVYVTKISSSSLESYKQKKSYRAE